MSADIYAALGNETRAKLILCLANKSKNVTELIEKCGLAQSAVSQHLAKLKKNGLVTTTKKGKEVYYSLKCESAVEISKLLIKLQKECA